jgi:hypothetical protein
VNLLVVVNRSDKFVFFMDGDILAGARQNRVLNTSILLAPGTETKVPVSCVERGRWHRTGSSFRPVDYVAPSKLRREKARAVTFSLGDGAGFEGNQEEVWSSVDEFHARSGVKSPTMNLSDIYDQKHAEFDDFLKRFQSDPDANGVVFFVGNHVLGVDVFNRRDVFQEYFPKLLRSVALEAFYMQWPESPLTETEGRFKALEFLDAIEYVESEEYPGVGAGRERRFSSPTVSGFKLMYENHLVHLTALKTGSDVVV